MGSIDGLPQDDEKGGVKGSWKSEFRREKFTLMAIDSDSCKEKDQRKVSGG